GRKGGESRTPTRDPRLVAGAEPLFGNAVAAARAGEILAAVEHPIFPPTRRDMIVARGIGAGRVAGDEVVDLEPVFDGADSLFDAHVSLPHIASVTYKWRCLHSLLSSLGRSPRRPTEISPPRDDFADRARVVGGEEQPAIGNRDDGACSAAVDRNRIFTDQLAVRRHAADLVGKLLGEPEIAIRRHGDAA